ncbi:hypothetical protein TUM4261_18250 [Shewanella sp. c952]|nr:hypothetical protein TUM4261_18250 [Shewanella sp. c952]
MRYKAAYMLLGGVCMFTSVEPTRSIGEESFAISSTDIMPWSLSMMNTVYAGTDGSHRPPDSAEPGAEEEMERGEFVGLYDDSWDIDWEDEWRSDRGDESGRDDEIDTGVHSSDRGLLPNGRFNTTKKPKKETQKECQEDQEPVSTCRVDVANAYKKDLANKCSGLPSVSVGAGRDIGFEVSYDFYEPCIED